MSDFTFLLPVFVQIALTFVLMIRMGMMRTAAIRRGVVKVRDIALGQSAWPEDVTKAARSFHNQLETPTLFYAWAAFTLIVHKMDWLGLGLAWAFVAGRIAHALVHNTSNFVPHRFQIFVVCLVLLIAMWALLFVKLAVGV
jgi:hypothetical protein